MNEEQYKSNGENNWSSFSNKNSSAQKFKELKVTFKELGFPTGICYILKKNGFDNLSDLLGLQKSDILTFPGFENDHLEVLSKLLEAYNLKIPLTFDQPTNLLPSYFDGLPKSQENNIAENTYYVQPQRNKKLEKNNTDENKYIVQQKNEISWDELQNIFLDEKINFDNFDEIINKILLSNKTNELFELLLKIFSSIDSLEFELDKYTFEKVENYQQEITKQEIINFDKKVIKYQIFDKFLSQSSNTNGVWLKKITKEINQKKFILEKKLTIFLSRMAGMTLQEIADLFGESRENARVLLRSFQNLLGINIRDIQEFSRNLKKESVKSYKKNIIEKHFEEFGRLPIRTDIPNHNLDKNEFYLSILDLNPGQRMKLLDEYNIKPSEAEFDYHYEYFEDNEIAGPNYWRNFDFLKEYIYRHAKALGEPHLMPKQTSFPRRGVGGAIGNFGGQSAVAKKIGLEYQGQLVNEGGGRAFWTEDRLTTLIFDVNEFFNQSQELLPTQIQIHNYIESTDKELYANKKGASIIAAYTKLGNLDWLDVAEKFGKKLQRGGQGVTSTYIKSFVRDLGEHLAVLSSSELYVLFQAQGLNNSTKQFSRTFDFLIDAVQSGTVNKKDLIDWSNNIEVPSIKELLDLGSDVRGLTKEEREIKLLKRRSIKIKNENRKAKVINLAEISKEDLPSLDPGKTLRALDKAAGVIQAQGSDLKLIQFLKAKATAKLWDSCFSDERKLISQLESNFFDKDSYSSQVKEAFLEEYNGAKNLEIPSTYKFRDLKGIPRSPKLMQKLVAFRVQRDKRLLNLSGTGTGKTLSAILAAQVCNCQRVFISCPNGVVDSWERALKTSFPEAILHIKPKNWKIDLIKNKTNFVIVNHERLQERFTENLLEFCVNFQSELIVIDEIHQSKSRKENSTSQRRELIKEFIRISSNLNDGIKVLGLSATPVINNLYEGRSLIELVTQKILADVKGDDINSCMNLYQHFILNSIRMNPGNLSRTKIIKKDIDTSNLIEQIIEINNSPKLVKYHDLERLFVKPKLKILEEVIEEGVKTIIFITLIHGTLIPITNWLQSKNKKFSVYTGDDKEASEEGFEDSLDEFINGETEILVATIQCAGTGIDGLQSVCNKAVFFQLPWTSTEFEQSVGRLDRDGTEFDSVEVFLPITYLDLPNGDVWSWCESKLERIRSKKDIAKASVDGDLPEGGSMISPQEATKYWLKWLERLESDDS